MPTITEIAAIINLCAVHSKNFMRDPVPDDRNQQTGGRSEADRGQAGGTVGADRGSWVLRLGVAVND